MVVEHADILRVTALPPKYDTPLIIDPDRMKIPPIAPEPFESITGRNPQITKIRRIVQIQQFPPRLPTDFWWKPPCLSRVPVEKQILGQAIPETCDHVPMLSECRNFGN